MEKQDIYTRITNKIIADLEKGVRPWMKPWNAENTNGRISRPLRHNGQPYSGINILMLWAEASERGYSAPGWMTFNQAAGYGANVRKGEHGSLVVYANSIKRKEENEDGEDEEREIHFLKGYTVFNVEQIDGLPEHFYGRPPPTMTAIERIHHAEQFFSNIKADIRTGGNRAYYALEPDYIQLPPIEAFRDAESYYATEAHEAAHWTRHPSRQRTSRQLDTRRKIIVGAAVLNAMDQDPVLKTRICELLQSSVTRPIDREAITPWLSPTSMSPS